MKAIRARLGIPATAESGVSLVEIIVAMMIFALISIGVISSMTLMLTQTNQARSREVATNLAAQTIDTARATTNLFNLLDDSPDITVDGQVFHVDRKTQWVSDPTLNAACGAGGGALQYKRVNVTVKWDGMLSPSNPVRADTLIAPKARVSDPEQGTILVSVGSLPGSGTAGTAGVTITTTPALSPPPSPTDAQGCSYLLKVPPGTYTIKVSKAGYVDPKQNAQPSQTISIGAGTSIAASFQLDQQKPLTITYAAGSTPMPKIPTDLETSLLHASDTVITTSNPTGTVQLYPFTEGYTAVAGRYLAKNESTNGCLSTNPAEWPLGTDSTGAAIGPAVAPAVIPAAGATVNAPMGIVMVTASGTNQYLTAVSQTAPPLGTDDPGCSALTMTYHFGKVLSRGTPVAIALPYGSWQLYNNSSVSGLPMILGGLSVASPSKVSLLGVVTLDPRKVLP